MSQALSTCILELINVGSTLVATIITRWLLELATPADDMKWLKSTRFYKFLARIKFYQGIEYIRQVKAKRIYVNSIANTKFS